MTIYQNKSKRVNYRKLWESHHEMIIPKDEFGRTYDIHHVDGNRNNNSIENLIAVSIQEHYDIHYSQGDWGACAKIAIKMKMSPEIISSLSSMTQLKKVKDGSHHFLGGEIQRKNSKRHVDEGTHNFLGRGKEIKEWNLKRAADGTHPWKDSKKASERNKKTAEKMVAEGTHPLLGSVTCRNKQGYVVQVPKQIYHEQKEMTADRNQWEFVHITSKEGIKRKLS